MVTEKVTAFDSIFHPRHLAILDASKDRSTPTGAYLEALLSFGFKGELFLISADNDEINGRHTFSSLADLRSPIDLFVTGSEGDVLYNHLEQAISKGAKTIILLNSLSRQSKLPSALLTQLRQAGIRLIGPESFGIYSPNRGLTLTNGADFPPDGGDIGLISPFGLGACDIIYASIGRGIKFSQAITTGREYDLSSAEMIDYFSRDPATRITGAVLDDSRITEQSLQSLKKHSRRKPLVVLHQRCSQKACPSSAQIDVRSLIAATGAIVAGSIPEFVECLMTFALLEGSPLKAVGAIADNQAQAAEIIQSAQEQSFTFPDINGSTSNDFCALQKNTGQRFSNPLSLEMYPTHQALTLALLDLYAEQPAIDMTLISQRGHNPKQHLETADSAAAQQEYRLVLVEKAQEIKRKTGKQMVMVLQESGPHPDLWKAELERAEARAFYTGHRIPCYDSAQRAFSALSSFNQYYQSRKKD